MDMSAKRGDATKRTARKVQLAARAHRELRSQLDELHDTCRPLAAHSVHRTAMHHRTCRSRLSQRTAQIIMVLQQQLLSCVQVMRAELHGTQRT